MQPCLLKDLIAASGFCWGNSHRSTLPCKATWGFDIHHGSALRLEYRVLFLSLTTVFIFFLLYLYLLLTYTRGRKALLFSCSCLYNSVYFTSLGVLDFKIQMQKDNFISLVYNSYPFTEATKTQWLEIEKIKRKKIWRKKIKYFKNSIPSWTKDKYPLILRMIVSSQ